MKEWFTPAELAALKLPDMPTTVQKISDRAVREGWRERTNAAGTPQARWRKGRGGGWEYHYTLLPSRAQLKLANDAAEAARASTEHRDVAKAQVSRDEAWRQYEAAPDKQKDKAKERLTILQAVWSLERGGCGRDTAVYMTACENGVGTSTIYNWQQLIAGVPSQDRLAYLLPRYCGRTKTQDCDPEAWEAFKGDFLRPERPSYAACYRRLQAMARERGWTIPSQKTLQRRMESEVPKPARVLAREGREALKQLYPAQERDRSLFHALEAVNADGHVWDVQVAWPDGTIDRPRMVAFQDLYSGMILSWRVDRSENKDMVRLALGDLVELYGIPDICFLDNGRNFASKWVTGGTPNRYRFKVRGEEPAGILTQLGVEVHWTQPYSGQSKPIERAFRDFAQDVAKHPKLAGAYTGNAPNAKPDNYGQRAIPLETFLDVIREQIDEHNTRRGRRSRVCNGRSFLETFEASYQQAPIRQASRAHKRLFLLAAESVRARKPSGAVHLAGNKFWCEALTEHVSKQLVVRFDPEDLHGGVHLYRMDGTYIAFAHCWEAAGFADTEAARRHSRARRHWLRAQRDRLAAERQLSVDDVAQMLPSVEEPEVPENKVARPAAFKAAANGPPEASAGDDDAHYHQAFNRAMGQLRVVKDE